MFSIPIWKIHVFYWIKSHLIHYLSLIVDNLTRSFALLKCWELRRFYCYFNLSPKIIAWSLLEMKNLLGLLFLHTITHPYILEIWLDRKAGKKLQHKKSNFCCSVKYILNTSFCIHEDPIMPHLRIRFSPVLWAGSFSPWFFQIFGKYSFSLIRQYKWVKVS